MRKIYLLLLFIFPVMISAQVITYDTIRVSLDDERNIYRTQRQQQTAHSPIARQPVLLDREPAPGFRFDKSKLRYGANIGLSFSRN